MTALALHELRPGQRLQVVNQDREVVLVQRLELALRLGQRLRGLLGRSPLAAGEGLLIRPCNGVHTFFMGYPIDVLFLDRQGQVVAAQRDLRPWRLTSLVAGAEATLELAAGAARRSGTRTGDRLSFEPLAMIGSNDDQGPDRRG